MSCTTEIRASESHFKLARRMVESLSTKYNFPLEEGWNVVCNTSVEGLLKKFKKSRKMNNPFRDITKQRTSFSLFTKERRAKIAEQNPNASFTDLSKLVSKAWNSLSDKERQVFKDMEARDKERYRQECEAVRVILAAQAAANPTPVAATTVAPVAEAPKVKRVVKSAPVAAAPKSASKAKTAAPVPAAVPVAVTPVKTKAVKAAAPAPTPVAAAAAAPVKAVAVKAVKVTKAKAVKV
jgi:hypothetical protein